MNFKEWMDQRTAVEEREIDALYDKARIAVQLVRMYRPELLYNISTIANLASGAYGLYNSGENRDIIDPSIEQRLIYKHKGRVTKQQLARMPKRILKQYFPDLDMRYVNPGDTIRVNIKRILSQSRNDLEAVLEIASTIIHESMHDWEKRGKEEKGVNGSPLTEITPQSEEKKFMQWAQSNLDWIVQQFPELKTQPSLHGDFSHF
jgi:hypothetical protein